MAQPDRQDHLPAPPAPQRGTAPSLPAGRAALAAVKGRYEGSLAQSLVTELKALDFVDEAVLFGAGLLVSLLPFVILLSAFASQRVDDDISTRLGLNHAASGIVNHLFTAAPASLNAATASSLIFVIAGMLTVASSLQRIYEKAFHQDHHRSVRDLYRLPVWVGVFCLAVVLESVAGKLVRNAPGGAWLAELVTAAVMTPFFWWTMHLLLGGRVPWRRLLPAAIVTGVCYAGLGVFSKFYFSSTITSDSKTYGLIGAILGIMTWLIAIGAVIILGAVAGAVWETRRRQPIPGARQHG